MSNNSIFERRIGVGLDQKTSVLQEFRDENIPENVLYRIKELVIEHVNVATQFVNGDDQGVDTQTYRKIFDIVSAEVPSSSRLTRARIVDDIIGDLLGFGPLQNFLGDPAVSEVMVCSHDKIYIERNGMLVLTDARFRDEKHVRNVLERIVAPIGRRIDESSPMVDARLPDGSRVNAVLSPIALDGTCITIRKFKKGLTIADLLRFGTLTQEHADLLKSFVERKRNIIISGGTNTGKTSLLNCLSAYIHPDERVVTVEDAAELCLQQPHVIRMETRPANVEGRGEITMRALIANALRMRPDRIIVGECRKGEAFDMLQAMNTGHSGSMTTIHANTPQDAIKRLESMILMAGFDLPVSVVSEYIASCIHVIVQAGRLRDGSRKVTYISVIENGKLHDVFRLPEKDLLLDH